MAPVKKDADKGDKDVKLTADQSAALMLDYLRKQNRPYSATDISANLKNRVTKAAAAKLLKDMHERNEIEGRAAGKQIVYHAIQDANDEVTLDQLREMETETSRLKEDTTALRAEERDLRLTLRENAAQVPLADLASAVTALEQQRTEMAARLDLLKVGNVKPVDPQERAELDTALHRVRKARDARKKIRVELWKEIEAAIERDKVAETKEALGLEF